VPLELPFGARLVRGDYLESWKEVLETQVEGGGETGVRRLAEYT
jgi:hypothetical protein